MVQHPRSGLALFATVTCMLALGCKEEPVSECTADADIAPGCAVTLDGAVVRLGDARSDALALLGSPDTALILPGVGLSDTFPALGLTALHAEVDANSVDALIVLDGFDGTTAEGLGLGSSRADVEAAYGPGVGDPFLGSAWYLDRGIGFEFVENVVSRVHVVPADEAAGE